MGPRANARANAVTGAMIRTLTAQFAHLQTQIDVLAELSLKERDELVQLEEELEEVPQLKADLHRAKAGLRNTKAELGHTKKELHHAKAELDEVPELKAELHHARAEVGQLQAELHHAKADHDELTQLKAELHHAKVDHDEVAQLKAELDHARSTEIPALKEHVVKLEAELNSSRVIPNNVTEATFDCGPQAYERAIEFLASNSHDNRNFQITALTEKNRMVLRFSVPFTKGFEVSGIGLQDD